MCNKYSKLIRNPLHCAKLQIPLQHHNHHVWVGIPPWTHVLCSHNVSSDNTLMARVTHSIHISYVITMCPPNPFWLHGPNISNVIPVYPQWKKECVSPCEPSNTFWIGQHLRFEFTLDLFTMCPAVIFSCIIWIVHFCGIDQIILYSPNHGTRKNTVFPFYSHVDPILTALTMCPANTSR